MPADQASQTVTEVIVESVTALGSEPQGVTAESTFTDLDIDSLDLAELAQIIEARFGVHLAAGDVLGVQTISDLVKLVEERA